MVAADAMHDFWQGLPIIVGVLALAIPLIYGLFIAPGVDAKKRGEGIGCLIAGIAALVAAFVWLTS